MCLIEPMARSYEVRTDEKAERELGRDGNGAREEEGEQVRWMKSR